jgi:DNA-binding Lrp family transcriptional regulator
VGIATNIDETDAKIITSLLSNARKSFVEIAAETNLSTVSIGDRFSELEKNGIITGSTVQINQRSIGRGTICTIQVTVDKKEINQVIDYIRTLTQETPFIFPDQKNNINLIVGCGDIDEVSNLKDAIRKNKFVLDLKVETWIGIKNMPENLELSNQTHQERPPKSSEENPKPDFELDSIDLQIIDKLTKNSMRPFGNIAKEIGTSLNTVSRKYRNLVNNRIIRPVLQINPNKLGYNAMLAFALSFASQSDTPSIINAVMSIKDTFLITKTNGNFDLLLQVFVRDIDQLLLTQNQVANIQGISAIEILVYPVPPQWPLPGEYISTF